MSSLVSSTWQLIKRHKGKFIVLGAAGGGFYMLNRYLSSWEKQWETSASRDFVSEVRKKEMHFENTIQTCNQTCISLAPKILDILDHLLNTEELLEQLKAVVAEVSAKGGNKKAAGERKIEIWGQLKIKIFTRLMAEIYCVSLFVCYLRVQLAVMGGYTYLESQNSPNPNAAHQSTAAAAAAACSQGVQHKYLSMLQAFYQDGIQEIIVPVQEAVEEAIGSLSLKERLSLADVREIFEKVKSSMAFSLVGPNSSASRYLIKPERLTVIKNGDAGHVPNGGYSKNAYSSSTMQPPVNGNQTLSSRDAEQLRQMLNETQEIIESDDFRRVLNSSIDIGFSIALDMVLGCFVRLSESEIPCSNSMTSSMLESTANGLEVSLTKGSSPTPPSSPSNGILSKENFSNPHTARIPLAKLLPALRTAINDRKKPDEQLVLVRHLLCLDVLNCFAANIYEAFCAPNTEASIDQPSTSTGRR